MKKCYCGLFIIFSVLLSSCNSIMDTTTHATVTTEAPIVSTTTITEEMTLTTETEITEETIETTIRTQEDINAAWEARLQNNRRPRPKPSPRARPSASPRSQPKQRSPAGSKPRA